ncbi:MAG: hypothetical protein K0Q93_1275 [Nocardioidaceae bacterium]|jgi:hypothetical protein|nr:hypothetical protein [Nocardioidaceae bacterium]
MLALAGVAAAAAGLPGCAASSRPGAAAGSDDTDDTLLARAAAQSAGELLAVYRATARRHPDLRPLLRPLAEHHAEHLAVLAPDGPPPLPRGTRVPRGRTSALAALRRRERAAARSRQAAVVDASSGDLARVLAAVVACQAQHLVLLDGQLR